MLGLGVVFSYRFESILNNINLVGQPGSTTFSLLESDLNAEYVVNHVEQLLRFVDVNAKFQFIGNSKMLVRN
jgi:hypothetical protein